MARTMLPRLDVKLSLAFQSPFFRLPFLVFAVVATVATTQPTWGIDAKAIDEDVAIEPGAALDRKITYEASHLVAVWVELSNASSQGTLDIELAGSGDPTIDASTGNGRCNVANQFELVNEGGEWLWRATGSSSASMWRELVMYAQCQQSAGTSTIKLTNRGESTLDFHLLVRAAIGGPAENAPEGAFVRAREVP